MRAGDFAAMVTAPVQKSVINDAGVPFSGHTEHLARATGAEHIHLINDLQAQAGKMTEDHPDLQIMRARLNRLELDLSLRSPRRAASSAAQLRALRRDVPCR